MQLIPDYTQFVLGLLSYISLALSHTLAEHKNIPYTGDINGPGDPEISQAFMLRSIQEEDNPPADGSLALSTKVAIVVVSGMSRYFPTVRNLPTSSFCHRIYTASVLAAAMVTIFSTCQYSTITSFSPF